MTLPAGSASDGNSALSACNGNCVVYLPCAVFARYPDLLSIASPGVVISRVETELQCRQETGGGDHIMMCV